MSFIEISELDETLNIDNNSVFPLVYQGATKKITFATLKSAMAYFNSASYNKTTGVLTLGLSNGNNATLDTGLDESIKDVSYANNTLTFTQQSGETIEIALDVTIADNSITAEKLSTELQNTINGKYNKPNTGIPKTDLAIDIQTSLGKADTSLQSTDIVSEVSSSSTNSKAVGAKLFYDTVGDLESILEELDVGGGVNGD